MTFKTTLINWVDKRFPDAEGGDMLTISEKISRRLIKENMNEPTPPKVFLINEISLAFQRQQSTSVPFDERSAEQWKNELQALLGKSDRLTKFHLGTEIIYQMARGKPGAIQRIRSTLLVAEFYIKREIPAEEENGIHRRR